MKYQFSRFLLLSWIIFFVSLSVGCGAVYGQSAPNTTNAVLKSSIEEKANTDIVDEKTLLLPVEGQKDQTLSKEYLLNNGLKVIFVSDKAFHFVSCFSWYKAGSRDDPPGMTGLAHLVEHLLFQNIGSFKGNQWANAVVRSGGEFSGFTSEDFTAFYSNLPTYQLELAISAEAARMRSAHFTKTDVAKEVGHLVEEAKTEEQDAMRMLNREVHALAYERHPYRNPPGGWRHELERLTYDDAKAYYDKYYYPNNATLVLAGDFDAEIALKLIEKYFGAIAKSENILASVYVQERAQMAERQIKLKTRNDKESIILAYRVAGINDADAPVISVLEQFVNAQIQGPLHAQLIDSGLCSSVQAGFEQKRDPGLLLIKCNGIAINGSGTVIQSLESSLNRLRSEQLSDAEVNRLVRQTLFTYYSDADGPYRCAFQAGFFSTLAKSEEVRLWPKKILQVKAADIMRVARTYLNENNRILGQIVAAGTDQTRGEKKIESSLNREHVLSSFYAKQTLEKTLTNNRLRLAAYETGAVKPSALPLLNNALAQSAPVVSSKSVKSGNDIKIDEPVLHSTVLRNGLRVIVLESHLNPLVQIYGSLKGGSIYEHANARGMSKLLAQLLAMGSMRTDKQQLTATQADLGVPPDAMLSFDSNIENITFHSRCLRDDFALQVRQLVDCLMEPRLRNGDFELAKTDLTTGLRRAEKRTETRAQRALLRSLIAPNNIYCPIHPEEEISYVSNFKLSDLVSFYQEQVRPSNTTILVCGDVQFTEVVNLIEQFTQGWILNTQLYPNAESTKKLRQPELILSNHKAYKSSIILPATRPAEIVFGKIIPAPSTQQMENYWAALSIADCALGGHPLFSHIVEQYNLKPQLFADISDNLWNTKIFKLADKLIWSLDIHLQAKSSSSASVNIIQSILSQFSKCGLRQVEVFEAKKYLIGSIPVKECANLEGLAQFAFCGVTELNEIDPILKMQKTINSLKYEDINEYIAKTFKPESSALVVAGTRELIRQIRPISQSEPVEANSD